MKGYYTQAHPDYPKPKKRGWATKILKYTDYRKHSGAFPVPIGKSLSLFGNFFYTNWGNGFFCFRFFGGYGLYGERDRAGRFILYSERMGLTKTYKAFGWVFKILKPTKL